MTQLKGLDAEIVGWMRKFSVTGFRREDYVALLEDTGTKVLPDDGRGDVAGTLLAVASVRVRELLDIIDRLDGQAGEALDERAGCRHGHDRLRPEVARHA